MDVIDGSFYSQLLNSLARKRKRETEEEDEEFESMFAADSDEEIIAASIQASVELTANQKLRKKRKPKKCRKQQKAFWTNGYANWDPEETLRGKHLK